jgi:hypothetical protein
VNAEFPIASGNPRSRIGFVARALALIVLILALTLGSCGGNGDGSNTDATSATGASGKARATTKHERSSIEKTVLGPKPGTPALAGKRRAVYLKAQTACRSRGRAGIASDYGLHVRNPTLVARLYSIKAFPAVSQGAAFAGCVAGFR